MKFRARSRAAFPCFTVLDSRTPFHSQRTLPRCFWGVSFRREWRAPVYPVYPVLSGTRLHLRGCIFICVLTTLDEFECETGIYTESSTAAKPYYIPTIKVTDEDGVEVEPQIDIPSRFETAIPDKKETVVGVCRDDRKIAQLNDLFEKYDFCTMAENLLQLGNRWNPSILA